MAFFLIHFDKIDIGTDSYTLYRISSCQDEGLEVGLLIWDGGLVIR